MRHLIPDLSTDALLRVAVALERRIIEGTARADDIDTYVHVQWELADRLDVRRRARQPVAQRPRRLNDAATVRRPPSWNIAPRSTDGTRP